MKILKLLPEFLRGQKLELSYLANYLSVQHQVHLKNHPDGRIILDYDHLAADKDDDIARECRGLVINNDGTLVGRSFKRFYNAAEHKPSDRSFIWECPVLCYEKVDGSFINLHYHRDEWKITTRFSFADSPVNKADLTWTELFFRAFPKDRLEFLETDYTYTFELMSEANRVVQYHPEPKVCLLTVFNRETELTHDAVNSIANELEVSRPAIFPAGDIFDVQKLLTERVAKEPTFEGFVVRDCHNNRLKVKSEIYLRLSKRIGCRGFDDTDVLRIYLDSGDTEFLTYFPELQPRVVETGIKFLNLKKEVGQFLDENKDLSQKEFALKASKTRYEHLLYWARRGKKFEDFALGNLDRMVEILA